MMEEAEEQEMVVHPNHYNRHLSGVECMEITMALPNFIGSAIEYVWRAPYKNGAEDLEKAVFLLEKVELKWFKLLERLQPWVAPDEAIEKVLAVEAVASDEEPTALHELMMMLMMGKNKNPSAAMRYCDKARLAVVKMLETAESEEENAD